MRPLDAIFLLGCAIGFGTLGSAYAWSEDAMTKIVRSGEIELSVRHQGEGPMIVLLPSLGRGADDFRDLAGRLSGAGFLVISPEPRGIGASRGPMQGLTMHDLAADVALVIEDFGGGPATVVGHAFGNRVARTLATDRPELVSHVILLAAGGKVPIRPEIRQALGRCFQNDLSTSERLASIQLAFFADGNDPSVWLGGWWSETAATQSRATFTTPVDEWWTAGSAPVLAIHALEDTIAPIGNINFLKEELGDRFRAVEIPNAGHAMLPEQPEAIADAILDYLSE